MSYTPHEWTKGETFTAAKFNNIEEGVAELTEEYTPHVWVKGETITSEKLNHIETAIADAVSGGSSDFSTAEVTITLGTGINEVVLSGPLLFDDGGDLFLDASQSFEHTENTMIAIIYGENETYYSVTTDPATDVEVSTTGNVSYADGYLAVSGNGTATFNYAK